MATDIHAEHVGSMLRPPWLLTARAKHRAGQITEGEVRATEDRAAAENIAIQRSAGVTVFTDGEARRTNWMAGILESIGGMSPIETPAVTWRRADMAKGGYDPAAEELFGTVPVDRFLLEYDTERAGGFEPLRFVRPGAVVVLGAHLVEDAGP